MVPDTVVRMTYDEWRAVLDRELDVLVVDDEGHRRCASERGLANLLTRAQAEAYYALNTFIRRRPEACAG